MTESSLDRTSNELSSEGLDVLIVHGKNFGVDYTADRLRKDNFNLSTDSRISTTAAGMLYRPGLKLILSTGVTVKGIPSEAEAMKRYLQRKFNVSDEDIILEEKSIDTAGNAEEVAKILRQKNFRNVGLLTVGYHKDNAVKLFNNFGVQIKKAFASEDILKERSTHHKYFVARWDVSNRVKKERGRENKRKWLLRVDPKGKLLRQVTSRTRGIA